MSINLAASLSFRLFPFLPRQLEAFSFPSHSHVTLPSLHHYISFVFCHSAPFQLRDNSLASVFLFLTLVLRPQAANAGTNWKHVPFI